MRIDRSISEWTTNPVPIVFAVGFFDGVHLGHQSVFAAAGTEASRLGAKAGVLTFYPHPSAILRPDSCPKMLTSREEKYRILKQLGAEVLLEIPFDASLANWEPDRFIREICKGASRPVKGFCMGENWSFGHNRSGNVAMLQSVGKSDGFSVSPVPPLHHAGAIVSSSRIRSLVAAANFSEAAACLGRPFSVSGTITRGKELGRTIGFPTANLAPGDRALPPDGVYAVLAKTETGSFPAVANLGIRPTVSSAGTRLLETHLLDFSGDLYGQSLEVSFLHFLREEKTFPSLTALKEQISRDAANARLFLQVPAQD